jgi:trehalose/maltose hydrolase-like predicted phosphorylase
VFYLLRKPRPAAANRRAFCLTALFLAGCSGPQPPPPGPAAPRGPAPIRLSADPWVLTTDSWDDGYRGVYLGNGFLGTLVMQTGTDLPASGPLATFEAGRYVNENLLALPPALPVRIQAGSQILGSDPSKIRSFHQELRLKEGLLVTRVSWDVGGGDVNVETTTAAARPYPQLFLATLKVDNRSGTPVQIGVPDEAVPGKTLPGAQLARGWWVYVVDPPKAGPDAGRAGYLQLAPLGATSTDAGQLFEPPVSGFRTATTLPGQQSVRLAVVNRFARFPETARSPDSPLHTGADSAKVDDVLAAHRKAWAELWEGDIEIEGDPEAQQVVRACLFYLLSSIRKESDAGIPPMGLSSDAFRGHVFWDMDSWMLPALLPQHPELARAMTEYRYRTLPGARENAKADGLPGASYAWESGSTGKEAIEQGLSFSHGRHVTGDVALALRQYYAATGDRAWLKGRAWPILKETADNWVARAKPDGAGGFAVNQVSTPDENAGLVDHSAWTHHVARQNLLFAGEAARALGQPATPRWRSVGEGLGFLRDPKTKLILPYKGFGERSKAKQADVLLLAFPGGAELSNDELGRMYDYYAPRVIANGPAMTDAIHAIVAARLGRGDEALKRFQESYRPFVRPPFHLFSEKRTRDNVCFLTGAAGVVEAVLYGFAGIRLESGKAAADRPAVDPHLPPGWKALRIRNLQWRGKSWDLEILPGQKPAWESHPRDN